MGRIVAIDYGQKRTGVACTDELQLIATGLTTVSSKDIFVFLKEYVQKENVECFVVGEAKQLNNRPAESAKFIEPFVKKLEKEFPTNFPKKKNSLVIRRRKIFQRKISNFVGNLQ